MSTFNIQNVTGDGTVMGDRNTVINSSGDPRQALQTVMAAIEHLRQTAESQEPVGERQTLRAGLDELGETLNTQPPSRRKIADLLEVIVTAAGATGAVGQAAKSLADAVRAWLGMV